MEIEITRWFGALPRVSGTWARHPQIGSLRRCHCEACAPEGLESR